MNQQAKTENVRVASHESVPTHLNTDLFLMKILFWYFRGRKTIT